MVILTYFVGFGYEFGSNNGNSRFSLVFKKCNRSARELFKNQVNITTDLSQMLILRLNTFSTSDALVALLVRFIAHL